MPTVRVNASTNSADEGGGWSSSTLAYSADGNLASATPARSARISSRFGTGVIDSGIVPDGATDITVTVVHLAQGTTNNAGNTLFAQGSINGTLQGSEESWTSVGTTLTERSKAASFSVLLSDLRSGYLEARVGCTRTQFASATFLLDLVAFDITYTEGGGGGTTHDAAVSFNGISTVALAAGAIRNAGVGYDGSGSFAASAETFAGDTTHDAQVGYSAAGSLAISASKALAGSVAYSGSGQTALFAQRLLNGQVGFTGEGSFATTGDTASAFINAAVSYDAFGSIGFSAQNVLAGALAYSTSCSLEARPSKLVSPSVAYAGVGAVTTAAGLLTSGAVAYAGAGNVEFDGGTLLGSAVVFAGVGAFSAAATLSYVAAISYSGSGAITLNGELGSIYLDARVSYGGGTGGSGESCFVFLG